MAISHEGATLHFIPIFQQAECIVVSSIWNIAGDEFRDGIAYYTSSENQKENNLTKYDKTPHTRTRQIIWYRATATFGDRK